MTMTAAGGSGGAGAGAGGLYYFLASVAFLHFSFFSVDWVSI